MTKNTIKLENGIEVSLANYKEQVLADYRGNPLIEALPPILSFEEAFEQLSFLPQFHPDERNLSNHHRYHAILRLTRFFQPIGQTLNLEQRFSRFIRYGYIGRNPRKKEHVQVLNELHKKLIHNDDIGLPPDIRATASSFTLMGFSGIGKTSAVERIISLYPQVILHKEPVNCFQIVWLKLNCPYDGSLKSLCMDFFQSIDKLIGTNYFNKYGKPSYSISSMVTRMGQLARLHCIGALIIDEIQHLLSTKGEASEKMMNFFVTLINEIGIPILTIGTMKAKTLLQKDFRQARRSSGQGDMVWQQMKNDDDWEVLITSMWDYQWTRNYTELDRHLLDVIYEESQGIVDIAVKLFILAQTRAIETETEKVTANLIIQVAKEDLKLVQPMLNALKSGNLSEIGKFEDIVPMDIDEYVLNRLPILDLKAKIQEKKDKIATERQMKDLSMEERLVLALINLDIETEIAERISKNIIKKNPTLSISELMQKSLELVEEDRKKLKNNLTKGERSKNQLQLVIDKGKKDKKAAYEALYEEGFIKGLITINSKGD
ncbi:ATP-binding protein [Heyndrickxia vini]|uniref:ATP-binding protein n=1 Tax=Heyndrickxia vini TaxID=1476025 RepID=UPI001FEA9D48|nr:ATP-binding protein [Heyndrickxia vini]